jgi:hypothetical protein
MKHRDLERRRRGTAPLVSTPIQKVIVCLPAGMASDLDEFGVANELPSRSAVVRLACKRLLSQGSLPTLAQG